MPLYTMDANGSLDKWERDPIIEAEYEVVDEQPYYFWLGIEAEDERTLVP